MLLTGLSVFQRFCPFPSPQLIDCDGTAKVCTSKSLRRLIVSSELARVLNGNRDGDGEGEGEGRRGEINHSQQQGK